MNRLPLFVFTALIAANACGLSFLESIAVGCAFSGLILTCFLRLRLMGGGDCCCHIVVLFLFTQFKIMCRLCFQVTHTVEVLQC